MITVHGEAFRRGLGTLALDIEHAAHEALLDTIHAAEQHAGNTRLFQDHTQRLRGSIRGRLDGAFRGEVRNAAPYAGYVEGGTAAHEIRARRASVLRFEAGGQTFYRARVWHPGTKPRPFMRQAGEHGTSVLMQQIDVRVGAAIRGS